MHMIEPYHTIRSIPITVKNALIFCPLSVLCLSSVCPLSRGNCPPLSSVVLSLSSIVLCCPPLSSRNNKQQHHNKCSILFLKYYFQASSAASLSLDNPPTPDTANLRRLVASRTDSPLRLTPATLTTNDVLQELGR